MKWIAIALVSWYVGSRLGFLIAEAPWGLVAVARYARAAASLGFLTAKGDTWYLRYALQDFAFTVVPAVAACAGVLKSRAVDTESAGTVAPPLPGT